MKHSAIAALMLGAALFSTEALAQPSNGWRPLWSQNGSQIGNVEAYYRPPVIHETDPNMRRMWKMANADATVHTDAANFRSLVQFEELDCAQGRVRTLQSDAYSEPFGGGEVVWSKDATGDWSYAIPGSYAETELKVACSQ